MTTTKEKVVVHYVQNLTIEDIDPDNLPRFANWDEADQFASGLQSSETINRWLMGLQAKHLPQDDPHYGFERWCARAGYSIGRVAVWRRMAEVFDFKAEVQKFPSLPHTHFEVLLGRMSRAKKLMADKNEKRRAEGSDLYEHVMDILEQAHDDSMSKEKMTRTMLEAEGKAAPLGTLPLKVQGQLSFALVDLAADDEPEDIKDCLVIMPKDSAQAAQWRAWANERNLVFEIVSVDIRRTDTE